ncbi:tetratricopeptide repeat protein [Geofilum sp. OHC36d9]|uniref:tetratricopeptide repeat protein n=1 Tax=Geofilum sp. OHC36d9 TaxID=3458413 RepID=UPI00403318AB
MKKLLAILGVIAFLFTACSPTKKITAIQTQMGIAYQQDDYETVLTQYEALKQVASTKKIEPANTVKTQAAKSAYKLKKYDTAALLFSEIPQNLKDGESIYMQGISYNKTKQSEMEYQHWRDCIRLLKENENYPLVLQRLFLLETANGKYHEADTLWRHLSITKDEIILSARLQGLKELGREKEALQITKSILKLNPENTDAIYFKAAYHYEKGETLYQSEMTKYNKNRNYTTYAYLRRELKKVSIQFRAARELFEKLHQLEPKNKTYINYLKNCYIRLDMKSEAAKMDKLL